MKEKVVVEGIVDMEYVGYEGWITTKLIHYGEPEDVDICMEIENFNGRMVRITIEEIECSPNQNMLQVMNLLKKN